MGDVLERRGIELVSITPDSQADLEQAIGQYGITTPMISDDDRDMSEAFNTLGKGMHADTPGHAFVLVEDGKVLWQRDYWLSAVPDDVCGAAGVARRNPERVAALGTFIRTSQPRRTLSGVGEQPNKKVVVIDDDPSVQEVVRGYLERDGYLVYVAGTAGEGLAVAERVKPGLIVLDLMLPDRSGEDVCREVRERSDVPILMLTAKASEDERVGGSRWAPTTT